MFERFTDRARKVMQLAKDEARRLNHAQIEPEHILLGLVKEGSGVAANVLGDLGVDLKILRREVEALVETGETAVEDGPLPLTPRAKNCLTATLEEAKQLSHNYVGTEHLLLGLLHEREGAIVQVWTKLKVSIEQVRDAVLKLLEPTNAKPEDPKAQAVKAPALVKILASVYDESKPLSELARLVLRLAKEKKAAVAAQNYEQAAQVRDRLNALNADLTGVLEKWRKGASEGQPKGEGDA